MLTKDQIKELMTIIHDHPEIDHMRQTSYLKECNEILNLFETEGNSQKLQTSFKALTEQVIKEKLSALEKKIKLLETGAVLSDPTISPSSILSSIEFDLSKYQEKISQKKILEITNSKQLLQEKLEQLAHKDALLKDGVKLQLEIATSAYTAIKELFKNYQEKINITQEIKEPNKASLTKNIEHPEEGKIKIQEVPLTHENVEQNKIFHTINELIKNASNIINADQTRFQNEYVNLMPNIISCINFINTLKPLEFDIKSETNHLNYLLSLEPLLMEQNTSPHEIQDLLKNLINTASQLKSKFGTDKNNNNELFSLDPKILEHIPLIDKKRILFKAVLENNIELLKKILAEDYYMTLLYLKNSHNESLLECAIKNKKMESIKIIIEYGGFSEEVFLNANEDIKNIMKNTKSIRREGTINESSFQNRGYKVIFPSTRLGKIAEGEYESIKEKYSKEYDIFFDADKFNVPRDILLIPKSKNTMTNYFKAIQSKNQFSLKKRIGWELVRKHCKNIDETYKNTAKKINIENLEVDVFDLSELTDYKFIVHSPGNDFLKTKTLGGKEKSAYFSCSLIDKHHTFYQDFSVILEVPPQAIAYAAPYDLSSPGGEHDYEKILYVDSKTQITENQDKKEAETQTQNKTHDYLPDPRYKFWIKEDNNNLSLNAKKSFPTVEEILSSSALNELIVLGDKVNFPQYKTKVRGIIMEKNTFDDYQKTKEGQEKIMQLKKLKLPIILVKSVAPSNIPNPSP